MRRVLKDDGRLVFSYQHRTAAAWFALASALAAGGWCPVQAFPLLGNSTAGLHQRDGTILWDAVTVCRKGPEAGVTNLRVSDAQRGAALARSEFWASRLERVASFRAADRDNLLRALFVAASLGTFDRAGRSNGRALIEVLTDLGSPDSPPPRSRRAADR